MSTNEWLPLLGIILLMLLGFFTMALSAIFSKKKFRKMRPVIAAVMLGIILFSFTFMIIGDVLNKRASAEASIFSGAVALFFGYAFYTLFKNYQKKTSRKK